MKSKFFFVCIMATAFAVNTLTAHTIFFNNTGVEVVAVKKTLQVKVAKTAEVLVEITIETATGAVVYNEKVANTATWKRYDLHQLEVGDYKLVVEYGRVKTIQPFSLGFTGIDITESERTLKGLPQIKQAGNGIDVRAYLFKKATIHVKITDNLGFSVFDEKIEETAIAKHYNLSKLPSGIYLVEVEADGETQYSTITLK